MFLVILRLELSSNVEILTSCHYLWITAVLRFTFPKPLLSLNKCPVTAVWESQQSLPFLSQRHEAGLRIMTSHTRHDTTERRVHVHDHRPDLRSVRRVLLPAGLPPRLDGSHQLWLGLLQVGIIFVLGLKKIWINECLENAWMCFECLINLNKWLSHLKIGIQTKMVSHPELQDFLELR